MPSHTINRICLAVLAALMLSTQIKAQQLDSLLKKVPRDANVIVLMDTEAMLKTPLAAKEGWAAKFESSYVDRALFVPPEASKLVIAGVVDINQDFERESALALMALSEPMGMRAIARAEGGYADTINGVSTAWVPSDAYFMEAGQNELAVISPADRQAAARWIDYMQGSATVQMPAYLRQIASHLSPDTQIVLGMDLNNSVQPHKIHQNIQESGKEFPGVNVDELIQLIVGIKGVTLAVSISDSAQGSLTIDFAGPVMLKPAKAKEIVLDALTELGAELPALADWSCDVTSTTIHLHGPMDKSSLRRIASLMELPTTKFSSLSDTDVADDSMEEMKQKSLAYFNTITSLLKDLRPKTIGNSGGGGDGVWMDRYARKIDSLPILHVDPELLDYGTKLSQTLRIMSGARKRSGVAGGVAAANTAASGPNYGAYDNYGYNYNGAGYGRWGGVGPKTALAGQNNAITAQKRSLQAGATNVRIQGWELIDNATSDIRRTMTERYQVEF